MKKLITIYSVLLFSNISFAQSMTERAAFLKGDGCEVIKVVDSKGNLESIYYKGSGIKTNYTYRQLIALFRVNTHAIESKIELGQYLFFHIPTYGKRLGAMDYSNIDNPSQMFILNRVTNDGETTKVDFRSGVFYPKSNSKLPDDGIFHLKLKFENDTNFEFSTLNPGVQNPIGHSMEATGEFQCSNLKPVSPWINISNIEAIDVFKEIEKYNDAIENFDEYSASDYNFPYNSKLNKE